MNTRRTPLTAPWRYRPVTDDQLADLMDTVPLCMVCGHRHLNMPRCPRCPERTCAPRIYYQGTAVGGTK